MMSDPRRSGHLPAACDGACEFQVRNSAGGSFARMSEGSLTSISSATPLTPFTPFVFPSLDRLNQTVSYARTHSARFQTCDGNEQYSRCERTVRRFPDAHQKHFSSAPSFLSVKVKRERAVSVRHGFRPRLSLTTERCRVSSRFTTLGIYLCGGKACDPRACGLYQTTAMSFSTRRQRWRLEGGAGGGPAAPLRRDLPGASLKLLTANVSGRKNS